MKKKTPDKRIVKLSYAKFEEEFGFKPSSKIEQTLFALKGRKPDPRILATAERLDQLAKAPKPDPQPFP